MVVGVAWLGLAICEDQRTKKLPRIPANRRKGEAAMTPKRNPAKLVPKRITVVFLAFFLIFALGPVSNTVPVSGHDLPESAALIPSGQAASEAALDGQSASNSGGGTAYEPAEISYVEGNGGISFSLAGLRAPEAGRDGVNPLPPPVLEPPPDMPSVATQVTPSQDATLESLTLTADGSEVSLSPAFDPDTTQYEATVLASTVSFVATKSPSAAGITSVTRGSQTTTFGPPNASVTAAPALTEGAITDITLTVQARDGVTTRTYHVAVARPADPSVPDVTIEASRSEYVAGLGSLGFTITRDGGLTDDLDLTVNL